MDYVGSLTLILDMEVLTLFGAGLLIFHLGLFELSIIVTWKIEISAIMLKEVGSFKTTSISFIFQNIIKLQQDNTTECFCLLCAIWISFINYVILLFIRFSSENCKTIERYYFIIHYTIFSVLNSTISQFLNIRKLGAA